MYDFFCLDKYANEFPKYSRTTLGKITYERELLIAQHFKQLANKSSFKKITDNELICLFKRYFSSPIRAEGRVFLKKDYYIQEMFMETPISTFKSELFLLLYSSKDLFKRWDRFMTKIKKVDSYNTSVLLSYTFPECYCLWPRKLLSVLEKFKLFASVEIKALKKVYNKASGEDYLCILNFMKSLKEYLRKCKVENVDYLKVITFIYYLYDKGR